LRLLTRYILKEYTSYLWYVIIAFVVIFVLVDSVEHIDEFIDDKIAVGLIVLYYAFYLPYIVVLTLPVSMLLATMFSLGRLGGDNEITAMKASGVSLYRILAPLYIFALFMGLVVMVFTEVVVPRTNLYREDIRNLGNDFRFSLSINREMDRNRIFLANGDGRIIYARGYSTRTRTAQGVFIIEPLHAGGGGEFPPGRRVGIRSRIDARYMVYTDDGVWELQDATVRRFTGEGEMLERYRTLPAPFIVRKPSDFARIELEPEEMNFLQLKEYIGEVRAKGGDVSEWLVDLYLKISFPFVSFVIVFFGAPMAAGAPNRGKTAAFGIALVIAFIYYALINASQVLGRNGTLDPLTAAWLPNGLFFTVGIFFLFRARK